MPCGFFNFRKMFKIYWIILFSILMGSATHGTQQEAIKLPVQEESIESQLIQAYEKNESPLDYLGLIQNEELITVLVEREVINRELLIDNYNARRYSCSSNSFLHNLCQNQNEKIIGLFLEKQWITEEMLLRHAIYDTPLHHACQNKNDKTLLLLIEKKLIDRRHLLIRDSRSSWTPLHLLCSAFSGKAAKKYY